MRNRIFLVLTIVAMAGAFTGAALASCIPMTAAEQRAQASVIFDGVALDSATATGVQRFRVQRYLKGSGPAIVRVATGVTRRADGTGTITSVSIVVSRGQRWVIFGRGSARKVVTTNNCIGSRRS